MKSDTTITCLGGDCRNGTGKLEIHFFDSMWEKSGIYEGECKNGLPHGRGVIRDQYGTGGILVKGTWVNGKYHGLIEYSDFMERYTDNEIYAWKVRYDNDLPQGELTGFDRAGRVLARWQYNQGVVLKERYYYTSGREIITTAYREDYVDSVLAKADTVLGRFRDFFLEDYAYRRKLTYEQTAIELIRLQREIVKHEQFLEELPGSGMLVCYPSDFIRGYILAQMHINRLTDYAKHWDSSATVLNSSLMTSVYMAQFLSEWGLLTPTVPDKQPQKTAIVQALKDIQLPRKVLKGIKVYITPFSITDTNGFYDIGYNSIFLFGGQSFKWPATETTVGHEMGHAFHYRVLTESDFQEYWELRKVSPLKDNGYYRPGETIAEDFRGYEGGNMARANTIGSVSISAMHHPWLYGTGDGSVITIEIRGDEKHFATIYRCDMPQTAGGRAEETEVAAFELNKGTNILPMDGLRSGLYRLQVRKITPGLITNLNAVKFTVYRKGK